MSQFLGLSGTSTTAMGSNLKSRKKNRPTLEELRRKINEISDEIRRREGSDTPSRFNEWRGADPDDRTSIRYAKRTADEWQQPGLPSQVEFSRRDARRHQEGVRRNLQTARDIDPDKFAAERTKSKAEKIEATTAMQAAQRKANEARRAVSEKARTEGAKLRLKEDKEVRAGIRDPQTINREVVGSEGYDKMVAEGRADMDRQEARRITQEQAETQRLKDWALKHQTGAKGWGPTPSDTGGGRVGVLPRRGGRRSLTQEEYEYLQRTGF